MDIVAELRSRFFPAIGRAKVGARITNLESLAVDSVAAQDEEMTRAGLRFNGMGVAAGAAPVQAMPTTTATHALFNPEPRKGYVIDKLGVFLLSGTIGTGGALLVAIVSPITATLPGAATGALISNASNGGNNSKAIFATAYTIPTPANQAQWFVAGTAVGGTAAGIGPGGGVDVDVKGRIIIPPRSVLGLAVLSAAGTSPLFVPFATWHEAEIDLE